MPMNHSIARHEPVPQPKKRPHPNDGEQDAPEPVHKLFISERFAKDLAAMSLNHKDDMANDATTTTTTIPATGVSNTAQIDGSVYEPSVPQRQRTGSVVVIDNINDFLSDDEGDSNNMETDFLLPMQKRPWDQKYHIPDFVLQTSRTPKSIRELVLGSSYSLAGPSSAQTDTIGVNEKPKEKRIIVLNKVPSGLTMDIDDSESNTTDSYVTSMDVD